MIPDEVVEQVRESADIVQIIGEHVSLKRTGTDFRGPCPFHQGTHRNFSVSPRKKIFYCFVCHEGGDVFQFLQKRLGIDWPSAVRMAAEKAGIEVREVTTRQQGPDPREPLWEVNATAAAYFQRTLWEDELGAAARSYLEERDISRAVAEEFGLGFAPREIGLLRGHMSALGFGDERLLEAGLLVRRDDDSEPRPRFRGRLMFPILDAVGHPVGFGGRLLGPGEPKYLNSAESPIFSKGKTLYGLNWSKNDIRREDRVFVVEGYFDLVRLMSAGIRTVVAPLGTALTEGQAALLRRYTANVYLLYDSDKAGLKATFKSGDELLRQKASVRVVTLPPGEDPDSFVREHGASGFNTQVASAVDVLDRKIQILERAGWFAELHRKRRALDRLLPTLRAAADPLLRDLYLTRVGEVSGVARAVLQRELGAELPDVGPHATSPTESPPAPSASLPRPRTGRGDRRRRSPSRAAERELIRAMIHHPEQVERIAEQVGADSFFDPSYKQIFSGFLEAEGAGVEAVVARLDEDASMALQALLAEPFSPADLRRTVEDSLSALRVRDLEQRLEEISKTLPLASEKEKDVLMRERMTIVQEIGATGKPSYAVSRSRSR